MTDIIERAARFSHHDHDQMQDPYPFYAELRSKCPIAHADNFGGFYFVSRYDAVSQVYSDFRHFSSTEGAGLPAHAVKLYPIDLDPPQQTKYRKILNPFFTPQAVDEHRGRVEEIVHALIDDFVEDGAADLGYRLIRPALSSTVLPILGVPVEDQPEVAEQVDYMARYRAIDPEGCAHKSQELSAYLLRLVASRRHGEPGKDVLQALLGATIDGEALSDDHIFRVLIIILLGGLDTTSAAMAEALLHLARHPRDAKRLRSGEVAWSVAIEEFVRFASPVQGLRRTVREPVMIEGATLQPGAVILALNAAANRDPEHFADVDRCVIDRKDNTHLGFGIGAHVCLGRNVARLVIEVVIKAVLERLDDYRIAEDFKPEYAVGESRGIKSLPATFTPGYRRSATSAG